MHKKIILAIEIYLTVTVILFLFGPVLYPAVNRWQTLAFLTFYQLALFLGFYIGEKHTKITKRITVKPIANVNSNLLIALFLLLNLFFSFALIQQKIGVPSLSGLITAFQNSIRNAGQAYRMTLEGSDNAESSLLTTLNTLLSPLTYAIIPYCIYFYKKIDVGNKALLFLAITMSFVSNILTGTNVGIFRLIITIATILLVKGWAREQKSVYTEKKLKKRSSKNIVVAILLFVFITIFSNNVTSRMQGMGYTISGLRIDYQNWLFQLTPAFLHRPILLATFYISQGYYGMSLAFDFIWRPTFFLGNSSFLIQKSNMLGLDSSAIFSRTYISQMSHLWHPGVNWHTAYTWLANDLSFYGVVVYIFLLGFFLSVLIKEASKGEVLALILLPLFFMMVIFLPMNNNILGNPLTFMPLVLFTILHVLHKKIYLTRKN